MSGDDFAQTSDLYYRALALQKKIVFGEEERVKPTAAELLEVIDYLLEWIDAVPQATQLPAMPGIDRDYVNDLIARARG